MLVKILLCFGVCISGLELQLDPVEKIPMYDQLELKVRLVLGEEDDHILNSLEDVIITANLTNENSWAVRLLNDSISFTYQDRRLYLEFKLYLEMYSVIF